MPDSDVTRAATPSATPASAYVRPIDHAGAAGKSVTIEVEKFNPAQNLYRRLGFSEIADHGPHWEMEWRAAADERTGIN